MFKIPRFYLLRTIYHTVGAGVAEVGRLSASAKNDLNIFVGRVFANSRQKNVVFASTTKIATKAVFAQ